MNKFYKKRIMLGILILLMGFVLSACGSADDSDEDDGGLEGVSSANITETPVPTLTPTVDPNVDTAPVDEDIFTNLAPIDFGNITELQALKTLTSPSGQAWNIQLTPDENKLLVSGVNDVQVWSMETFQLEQSFTSTNPNIWDMALHPNGRYVVVIGDGGILEGWDIESGEILDFVETPVFQPTSLKFTPNGEFLALGYQGGITDIRNFETNESIIQVAWQRGFQWVASIDFTQDGAYVVLAHPDGSFLLWDTATGERIHRFIGHSSRLSTAVFSPDDQWLASTGQDNDIRLWNATTYEQVNQMQLQYDGNDLVFNPTSEILVSTGQSGRVRFWDVENGEELYSVDGEITDGTVWTAGAIFNHAGTLLIYAYADQITFLGIPESAE